MGRVHPMTGALTGIKVLDLSIIVQGPQAAALLHDLGAEVIKIELPGVGDLARWIPCGPDDPRPPLFVACNRGKRSATLDLRTEGGRQAFLRLVERSDVVVSNFQPGTLEQWDLGFDHLRTVNPSIILAAGSALGPIGPDAHREGADGVAQAAGGLISTTGVDGGEVTMIGAAVADHIGSLNMVTGVLAALHHRFRTGEGQLVETSLLGGQIWAQASEYTHFLLTGSSPGRANRGHPLVKSLYRMFATADGDIVLTGVPLPRWAEFCAAVERSDWAEDPRYAVATPTPPDLEFLKDQLAEVFKARTTADWTERLKPTGARFGPVNSYADVVADRQVWDNGYLTEALDPDGRSVRVVGNPIRFSASPMRTSAVVAELGQHTEEVLLEAGFDWDDIANLREMGAF